MGFQCIDNQNKVLRSSEVFQTMGQETHILHHDGTRHPPCPIPPDVAALWGTQSKCTKLCFGNLVFTNKDQLM